MRLTVVFIILSVLLIVLDAIVFLNTGKYQMIGVICFVLSFIISTFLLFYRGAKISSFVEKKYPEIYEDNLMDFQYDFNGKKVFNIRSKNIKEPEIVKLIDGVMEFQVIALLSFLCIIIDFILVFIVKLW